MQNSSNAAAPIGTRVSTAIFSWAFSVAALGSGPFVYNGLVPPGHMMIWGVPTALFLMVWGILVVVMMIRRPNVAEQVRLWKPLGIGIALVLNLSTVGSIFILLPRAHLAPAFVHVIFCIGYVATMMLTMPDWVWVGRLCNVTTMGSIIVVVLWFAVPLAPMLAVFCLFFGTGLWILSGVMSRSISSAHEARFEAEAARRDAIAQRDARARFLASASHDLGQPLQSARLFFDQAVRATNPKSRAIAIDEAKAAFAMMARQLHQMIEHLQLESGMVTPKLKALAAGPLVSAVASLTEAEANLAKVEIIAVPSRLRFMGDRDLVERVLSNLVYNALRHAKATRVLVGARWTGGRVRFWVIDDGVGLPARDLQHLFEDFAQGSDHGDEVRGGFGLGLASVRRMAALMRGTVGLDVRWKHGAAFYIELPGAA